tara:strand:+ start:728 stop:1531 length:804 start_codon:yes stop_codon:yes gene_type:complete
MMIMMQKILGVCLLLTACQNENVPIEISSKLEQNIEKTDFSGDSIYFDMIKSIDTDSNLFQASSLEYSRKDGRTYHSEGLIDAKNRICKLKTIINDTTQETIDEFYYINSKKRVGSRLISNFNLEPAYFEQYISFFDTSGTPIYNGFKTFDNMNDNEKIAFQETKSSFRPDDQTAKDIIQQKGGFETNFRGFIQLESYNMEFIKVGSNDGAFNSLLAVSEETDLIKKLKSNEKDFIGKPLRIEFTQASQADGFSFQLLLDISLNDKP